VLDVFTTLVLLSATCATLGLALLLFWAADRRDAVFLVGGACFLLPAAGLALLALRGRIPDLLSIELANALVLLGVGLLSAGVRVFDRRPLGVWFLAPTLLWLLLVPLPAINESTTARTALASLGLAFAALLIARELWRGRAEQPLARIVLTLVCLLQALASLTRAAAALGYGLPDNFLDAGGWWAVSLFQPVVLLILLAMFGVMAVMERQRSRFRRQAALDPLTGVLNRGGFEERARSVLDRAGREGRAIALVLFDLDRFKQINDRYGHAAGDRILVAFCRLAEGLLRRDDIFGRLGGEEFAVLLPDVGEAEALALAERIRAAFDGLGILHEERVVATTLSAGVAVAGGEAAELERLSARADRALYRAKAAGRNRVESAGNPTMLDAAGA